MSIDQALEARCAGTTRRARVAEHQRGGTAAVGRGVTRVVVHASNAQGIACCPIADPASTGTIGAEAEARVFAGVAIAAVGRADVAVVAVAHVQTLDALTVCRIATRRGITAITIVTASFDTRVCPHITDLGCRAIGGIRAVDTNWI